MLLLPTEKLPDDSTLWEYELKLDGFRSIAFKSGGKVYLRSRNDKNFASAYPSIVKGLAGLPDETVIDGEVVALDESGRPSFNTLQNHASTNAEIAYYLFDVLVLSGSDVMREPMFRRRQLLKETILPGLKEPVRYSAGLEADLPDLIHSVKTYGLEGLVAKRRDSRYEPGARSGAWRKMRVNRTQDFVIGGFTVGGNPFDAIIFGYYDGDRLTYVARTRNGFTPSTRAALFKQFKDLATAECPFINLPEAKSGRWGQGLTKEKMKDCRWLKPVLMGEFEFLEWTTDNHLRHSRFVKLKAGNERSTSR